MVRPWQIGVWLVACLAPMRAAATAHSYQLVVEAGPISTGFHLIHSDPPQGVVWRTLGNIEPNLASFADFEVHGSSSVVGEAVMHHWAPILSSIVLADSVPLEQPVPLRVLGTGGMRALSEKHQQKLYASIQAEFEEHYTAISPVQFAISFATLTEQEESRLGLVGTEYERAQGTEEEGLGLPLGLYLDHMVPSVSRRATDAAAALAAPAPAAARGASSCTLTAGVSRTATQWAERAAMTL